MEQCILLKLIASRGVEKASNISFLFRLEHKIGTCFIWNLNEFISIIAQMQHTSIYEKYINENGDRIEKA